MNHYPAHVRIPRSWGSASPKCKNMNFDSKDEDDERFFSISPSMKTTLISTGTIKEKYPELLEPT